MKKIICICCLVLLSFSLVACDKQTIEVSITPFPTMVGKDFNGQDINNDIFSSYDVTIVNFWNNGCGTCIEEMPELEAYYQAFKDKNIHFLGIGADSGESQEKYDFAKKIVQEKGVTYTNIAPDTSSSFYLDFIQNLTGYPVTYVVDKEGNIVGSPIIGNVKKQEQKLHARIELALK